MATGGGAAAHGVSVLLTEKFCEFLHSPCWLYPVIKFFSDCIDEHGYRDAFFAYPISDREQTEERFETLYNTYCELVGGLLVAYHKDLDVDVSDVIKTAAMLCEDCNPIGVRQDVVNFIRATLNLEYFSYTMMCYNAMFKIMCCHDMKRDIIQRDYEAKEMKNLLKFLHDEMELIFEEHEKVQKCISKLPLQLHNGPFLCCYGITLCDPDCDHDSFLEKLLYLTNEIFESSAHRPRMIQHLVEMFRTVTVDEEKVDKHIKELTSDTPTTSIEAQSEVGKVKASLLKASLDPKQTVFHKIWIFMITCDPKVQSAVSGKPKQKALFSDKSIAEKFKLAKVGVSQSPPPDPNFVRGVWPPRDTPVQLQMAHLISEYSYRNTQNLAYLYEAWKVQRSQEYMAGLWSVEKIYDKKFRQVPITEREMEEEAAGYSHRVLCNIMRERQKVITMLKFSTKLN